MTVIINFSFKIYAKLKSLIIALTNLPDKIKISPFFALDC